MKKFPLAVVLGLITNTVLVEGDAEELDKLVVFMTGGSWPDGADGGEYRRTMGKRRVRCTQEIIRQHPYLEKVEPPKGADLLSEWLHKQVQVYGAQVEIVPFTLEGDRPEKWCSLCCNTGRALSPDPGSIAKPPFIVSSECPACGGQSAQWIIPQEVRLSIRNRLLWNRFDLDTNSIREFDSKESGTPS